MDVDAEIFLETTRIGGSVEVRAISGGDGLEVAFIAPASATKGDINQLARAKLAWRRRKLAGEGDDAADDGGGDPEGGAGKGGLIA